MGRFTHAALVTIAALTVSLVGPLPGAQAVEPAAGPAVGPAVTAQPVHDGLVSDDPAGFTPHVLDGEVDAIAVVGDRVILGGQFTRAQNASGGPELSRVNLMAFNRTTGLIDTGFVPLVDGRVRTLVASPDGQSVYVGGQFNTVGGQPASKLMRLSVSTGQKVAGFNPAAFNALVYDAKLVGGRLFVAGQFSKIGNQQRSLLAELDPTTGALRPTGSHVFAGTHHGGTTHVYKIDVNEAGMLVAIGNFATVNGQPRVQVAAFDASGPVTLMDDWRSSRYEPMCYDSFDYYIRDVDFAPDGSYFVINTTGGYGSGPPTLCDTASRWTTTDRGQAVDPLWVNYNGGDSFYANETTGSAIYLGGHNRWQNNPFAADAAGPGAVERPGIGATDPTNGVPLSWNPGRTRGRGVFDMVATSDGLWVGSDTDRIGKYEYHGRIAFFPLVGGTAVAQPDPATLPVDAYTVGGVSARYLYRVNTGAEAIASIDAGPEWAVDTDGSPSPYRNGGSNAAGYAPVPSVDATVPAGTPSAVFSAERWDPGDATEMAWDFPVPAGRQIEVRLYLANRCTCTQGVGQRVFDVALDGTTVLDDLDLVASAGHDVGTMRSFTTTSDGNVDIDFRHVVENPLVNAIEIVDLDAGADPGPVTVRTFDGDTATPAADVSTGSVDWSAVRGGFWLDGSLYLASSDGTLTVRSYDGTTFGPSTVLPLYNLTQFQAEMVQMTSLAYLDGSIYFTLGGDPNLYRRGFSVESGIVGALRHTVASGGIDWRQARGAFVAGDALYWSAAATGDLHEVSMVGTGQPGTAAPQAGTDTVVSGPAVDGRDWRGRAMFTLPGPPPNQPPTASFTSSCVELTCSFDGTGSADADGTLVDHAWTFGGGGSASGATTSHTFDATGTFPVTLTVTDDDGASGTTTRDVTVAESSIAFVGAAQDSSTGSKKVHTVVVPGTVQAGDVLVLGMSTNSSTSTISDPAGWTRVDTAATSGMTSVVWSQTATAASAGSTVTVTTSLAVRDALLLSTYRGAVLAPGQTDVAAETVNRAAHTTPARTAPTGSWVVSFWADKTAATTSWTPPAAEQVRLAGAGTGAGHLAWLVTDSGGALSGPVGGLTATASSSTAQATMATVVLAPLGGGLAPTAG